MSLLYNMLSRLVIAFLPRSKHFLISWLQSSSAVILEPPKIKSDTVSIVSPFICHEVIGPDAMIFIFWMLSFKPTFSLSTFTTIIQHSFGSPSYSNQRRKRNKRNPDQKRRSKALFADDMILYIENPKHSIRKLLQVISESWAQKNWCFWTVVVGEDSWESLGLQEDPTSPS